MIGIRGVYNMCNVEKNCAVQLCIFQTVIHVK